GDPARAALRAIVEAVDHRGWLAGAAPGVRAGPLAAQRGPWRGGAVGIGLPRSSARRGENLVQGGHGEGGCRSRRGLVATDDPVEQARVEPTVDDVRVGDEEAVEGKVRRERGDDRLSQRVVTTR